MPSLKEIAGKTGNKKTHKNKIIRYISLLFIRSKKRPCYVVINQAEWNYLTSLPGITGYLDINYLNKHEHSPNILLGTLWGASILLVNETEEIKVYHGDNIDDMIKDFPDNKTLLKYTA